MGSAKQMACKEMACEESINTDDDWVELEAPYSSEREDEWVTDISIPPEHPKEKLLRELQVKASSNDIAPKMQEAKQLAPRVVRREQQSWEPAMSPQPSRRQRKAGGENNVCIDVIGFKETIAEMSPCARADWVQGFVDTLINFGNDESSKAVRAQEPRYASQQLRMELEAADALALGGGSRLTYAEVLKRALVDASERHSSATKPKQVELSVPSEHHLDTKAKLTEHERCVHLILAAHSLAEEEMQGIYSTTLSTIQPS